eukprot:9480053-Pyramimonas_sp.AAC.1
MGRLSASSESCATQSAARMQVPTTVEVMALPARSAIWSSLSRVSSRSSTGMPWRESASRPTRGPPRLVT